MIRRGDAGIRQTWAFAHPRNRAMTGPLPRFATMLKGPGYEIMLNHASHQIVPANSGDGWQQFDVFMESGNGKLLQFAWIVEKVTEGQYKDCWMTVAVSRGLLAKAASGGALLTIWRRLVQSEQIGPNNHQAANNQCTVKLVVKNYNANGRGKHFLKIAKLLIVDAYVLSSALSRQKCPLAPVIHNRAIHHQSEPCSGCQKTGPPS